MRQRFINYGIRAKCAQKITCFQQALRVLVLLLLRGVPLVDAPHILVHVRHPNVVLEIAGHQRGVELARRWNRQTGLTVGPRLR